MFDKEEFVRKQKERGFSDKDIQEYIKNQERSKFKTFVSNHKAFLTITLIIVLLGIFVIVDSKDISYSIGTSLKYDEAHVEKISDASQNNIGKVSVLANSTNSSFERTLAEDIINSMNKQEELLTHPKFQSNPFNIYLFLKTNQGRETQLEIDLTNIIIIKKWADLEIYNTIHNNDVQPLKRNISPREYITNTCYRLNSNILEGEIDNSEKYNFCLNRLEQEFQYIETPEGQLIFTYKRMYEDFRNCNEICAREILDQYNLPSHCKLENEYIRGEYILLPLKCDER